MGLGNYFKSSKKQDQKNTSETEKPQDGGDTTAVPTPGSVPYGSYSYGTSRASLQSDAKSSNFMSELKQEVQVNYLFQQQCTARWIGDGAGEKEGVLVRKARDQYLSCPPDLVDSVFGYAVTALNLPCCMTVNSRVIKTFLSWAPNAVDVPLKNGLRVQVMPTMDDLVRARKLQFAAFIAHDGLLVVWDDGEYWATAAMLDPS